MPRLEREYPALGRGCPGLQGYEMFTSSERPGRGERTRCRIKEAWLNIKSLSDTRVTASARGRNDSSRIKIEYPG